MPTAHAGHTGHTAHKTSERGHGGMNPPHYRQLAIMIGLSFLAMYLLMYAMVDSFANVYMNFNQVYMAGLMAAPMVLIELAVMRAMYRDSRLNLIAIVLSLVVLAANWTMIRKQTLISDTQFLRSMISHHAGALLMCREAPLQDAEIRQLCKSILTGQTSEIELMKTKLQQLDR